MLFVRSLLYTTLLFLSVIPGALWALFARPFGYYAAYRGPYWWGRLNLWALRVICGIEYRVEGAENIARDRVMATVAYGDAGDRTIETAMATKADHIVLARRGSGLVAPALLGSTLGTVLHGPRCRELVIPAPPEADD